MSHMTIRLHKDEYRLGWVMSVVSADEDDRVTHECVAITMDAYSSTGGRSEVSRGCDILLAEERMQRIMDDLWAGGLRPRDFVDTKGIVDAKNEHIKDLRLSHEVAMGAGKAAITQSTAYDAAMVGK